MLYILPALVALFVGYVIGYNQDKLRRRIKDLENKPQVNIGATPASYGRINEFMVNQPGQTGLVMPKTPTQLEYEEQERLRQEQLEVRVRPRN